MSRVWFVTGSSRGLGREVVAAALDAGDRVLATARRPADLDDLIARYGDRIAARTLDVTDADAAPLVLEEARDTFGRIDVVVNNAGYANMAAIEDITLADFHAQFDTNFFGTVNVSKAALPILREQGSGHIIQIASVGARIASVGLSAYQAAKFAVRGFSLVLAQEVAPLGIKVTVVQPGGMRTDWAGSSMEIPDISEPYQQSVGQFAKMLRDGSGKEHADPAKIARQLLGIAGRDDAPVELLMGADAYEYAGKAVEAVAASDKQWEGVTTSVAA